MSDQKPTLAAPHTMGGFPGDADINPTLSRALEAVSKAWPDESGYRPRDEIRDALAVIAQAVTMPELSGPPSGLKQKLKADPGLYRKLFEATSQAILLGDSSSDHDDDDPAVILEILRRLELFRRAALPKDAWEFASRFAEPDGFDLLVEVAHDLRSPLTSITFLSETLRAGHSGEVNELQQSQLGLIWSAAFGMTSVFSDIMDLAKARSGVTEEPEAPFSIRGVFEEVDQMVGPMVEVKGLDLRFTPPVHEQVWGNEVALFRVLLNLVSNAIKFTDDGSVEVVAETVDRDLVLFSVGDTGRGIDEESMKTLFAPFKKAGAGGGYFFSGTGLGLAIARRYVQAMGSDLEVESIADRGTRFSFQLRLPPAADY